MLPTGSALWPDAYREMHGPMTRLCPECFDNAGLKPRLVEIRPSFPDERCDFHPRLKGIHPAPSLGLSMKYSETIMVSATIIPCSMTSRARASVR